MARRQELDLAQEVLDHAVPEKAAGGAAGGCADPGGDFGVLLEEADVPRCLGGVCRLQNDAVLQMDRVVLARSSGHDDRARGHRLQADEAERLVTGVGEHGVGGFEEKAQQGQRHERLHVQDVRPRRVAEGSHAVGEGRPAHGDVPNEQPETARALQHLSLMGLDASQREEHGVVPARLQVGDGLHRHQPALVGIPASHLGQHHRLLQAAPEPGHLALVGPLQQASGNAVGDDQGVHAATPHQVLHVAAHGRDGADVAEPPPVDALEAHRVVGVPEEQRPGPSPGLVQQIRDAAGRLRGVPLLSHDHHELARLDRGAREVLDHERGRRLVEVVQLRLLALVDPARVVLADPLTPPVQDEPAARGHLRRAGMGVADEHHVGAEAGGGQRAREPGDPHAEASCGGVAVRSFE